ncbi:hypothetical protein C8R44DRAFT_789361 [Mycena epipterygia]|nr:hypothetical protein C8R44DRAFT_789361 [Mycena epipterygia]
MPPKRKRHDTDGGPSSNTRARRFVKTEPAEVVLNREVKDEGEDHSPGPVATTRRCNPRRGIQRVKSEELDHVTVPAATIKREPSPQESENETNSEVGSPRRRRWFKRSGSGSVDNTEDEAGYDPETPKGKRIQRGKPPQGDSEEEEAGDDSSNADTADIDDLELPVPPSPSKPSAKELKAEAFQQYRAARNHRSSPTSDRRAAGDKEGGSSTGEDSESNTDASESDETDAGTGDGSETTNTDFIVHDEDQTADVNEELRAALKPELYARRTIDEQFVVFVEYIARLYNEPNFLSDSAVAEDDKLPYQTAITALRKHFDGFANSMLLSTWSGPFAATLEQRPVLVGPVGCEPDDCQACWTRGPYSCSVTGSYTLSTRKGLYNRDHDTFQNIPEKNLEYGKETTCDFPNSAEAPKLPYPPGFRLVVGARCAHRAVAYHQARHYMHNIATRVRDEIETLCDQDAELIGNTDALLKALDEELITELWNDFKADSKHWREFQK